MHSPMLRPEVRCGRIWLHDCSLCRVLYFAFIAGHGKSCVKKSCVKKAATQTMFGCKKATFADSPPSFGSELPVSEKKNASSVGKIVVCGEHRVSDLELTVSD